MAFGLAYSHLTLAPFKGQDQVRAHFNCEYLAKRLKIGLTLLLQTNRMLHMAFGFAYLDLIFVHSKGQGHEHFDCEYI